jgi:hypothetical protein
LGAQGQLFSSHTIVRVQGRDECRCMSDARTCVGARGRGWWCCSGGKATVCGHHTELSRGGSEGVGASGRLGEHNRDTGAQVGHFMDEGVLVAVWGPGGRWNTWVHTAIRFLHAVKVLSTQRSIQGVVCSLKWQVEQQRAELTEQES